MKRVMTLSLALTFAAACSDGAESCDAAKQCGSVCCLVNQQCVEGVCLPPVCEPACGGETPDCVAENVCSCNATSCGAQQHCGLDGTCMAGVCAIDSPLGTFTETEGWTQFPSGSVATLRTNLPSGDDFLDLQLYARPGGPFASGLKTGTFQIQGDDLNYATCSVCVLLLGGDKDAGGFKTYLSMSGTVEITTYVKDSAIAARLIDVTFQQVDIDDATNQSVPSATGCTTSISDATIAGVPASPCDPLAPTCAANQGCYYLGASFFCAPAGTLTEGTACSDVATCVPGGDCLGGSCRTLCDTVTGAPCTESQTCQDVSSGAGIGVCVAK